MKRSATTLAVLCLTCTLFGSVVFTGISLSSKLLGRWRVVQVFDADISMSFPLTIDLDRSGRVIGRSNCGLFTGRWSTGQGQVRFQALVPSTCNCGEFRRMEQRLIEAMGKARETRSVEGGLILMEQGRQVAKLVPQRT